MFPDFDIFVCFPPLGGTPVGEYLGPVGADHDLRPEDRDEVRQTAESSGHDVGVRVSHTLQEEGEELRESVLVQVGHDVGQVGQEGEPHCGVRHHQEEPQLGDDMCEVLRQWED